MKENAYNDLRNKAIKFGDDLRVKVKEEKCHVLVEGFFNEFKQVECWEVSSMRNTRILEYHVFADAYQCE